MGYYTQHNLSILEMPKELTDEQKDILKAKIDKHINSDKELSYAVVDSDGNWDADAAKWYDSSIDMKKLSNDFKDVVFKLEGIGEESEDLWIAYYKNGMEQYEKAKLVYGDYDECKLTL